MNELLNHLSEITQLLKKINRKLGNSVISPKPKVQDVFSKEKIDTLRNKYIEMKGYDIKKFTPLDYARTAKSIKSLLTQANHNDKLILEALEYVEDRANKEGWFDWKLSTVSKYWPDFIKFINQPEILRKYAKKYPNAGRN